MGALISVPLIPLLYIKMVLNAAYIGVKNKRAKYKLEGLVNFLLALVLGPVMIVVSLTTDFFALNMILMKDEKHFEFKY